VGQGVFVGSSTEGNYDNTFVAISSGAAPSNANFTASYWVGLIDFPSGAPTDLKNALFQLTPNGSGTFGTISLTGQAENQSAPVLTQTVSGATYTFPGNGSISVNAPTPAGISATNALFSGAKTMWVSADGNFVLGYTPNGYDMIFGVKALASAVTTSTNSGLYYMSALEDSPGFGNPCGNIDSFYGSMNGSEIFHERETGPFCYAYDYEFDDPISFSPPNGNAFDLYGYQYAFGDGGQAFVAIGTEGYFSLIAGVHANSFSGTGVFLNPIGVTNAASYAPITASLTPGELVTLVGTGLANSTPPATQGGQAFPTILGGVQVMVNTIPAPIYYVSPTQISAILPYEISTAVVASIQVINNGKPSNTVNLFTNDALPGVFSQTANGLGLAAAIHAATGQLVTVNNPAVANEYLSVFLTGLGTVTPALVDGALGPSPTFSYADQYNDQYLYVSFDDFNNLVYEQATASFAGLAPGLAGLYQLNVQVPTGVGPGNVYLEVDTDYAVYVQIQVPVGGSVSALERASAHAMHGRPMRARMRGPKTKARTQAIEENRLPR
jgi:uncharacterized protein (TIGR03437 family)